MPRLLRPHIPLETRCRVVIRQLGELWPEERLDAVRAIKGSRSYAKTLSYLLDVLSELLGCPARDLALDHDPALGAREKVFNAAGDHIGYVPAANDPEHLIYREKHAHHIKTQIRGDGAQRPDRVLIKRNRKLEQKPNMKPKRKQKIPSRPFPKGRGFPKRPKTKKGKS